jgi:hypothetical protein
MVRVSRGERMSGRWQTRQGDQQLLGQLRTADEQVREPGACWFWRRAEPSRRLVWRPAAAATVTALQRVDDPDPVGAQPDGVVDGLRRARGVRGVAPAQLLEEEGVRLGVPGVLACRGVSEPPTRQFPQQLADGRGVAGRRRRSPLRYGCDLARTDGRGSPVGDRGPSTCWRATADVSRRGGPGRGRSSRRTPTRHGPARCARRAPASAGRPGRRRPGPGRGTASTR